MGIVRRCLWMVLVSLTLTGCMSRTPSGSEMLTRFPTPIYSLTGERLNGGTMGQLPCDEAQTKWLQRVDQDQDGHLELDELLTEAKRQFALMDLNHDGIVTPDELSRYRAQTTDTQQTPDPMETDKRGVHQLPMHPPGSQPDPVLSADSNLDFQVTLDEYLNQQKENMQHFDKDKDQSLDAQELNLLCRIREQAATPSRR